MVRIGEVFNPYGLFNGIFIPDALLNFGGISSAAKLLYGRLARYAGKDGRCFPSVSRLAKDLAMSERQVQRLLDQLCQTGFLAKRPCFRRDGSQSANAYAFLLHEVLAQPELANTAGDKNVTPSVTPASPLEDSQMKKDSELASEPARPEENSLLPGPDRSGTLNGLAIAVPDGRQSRPSRLAGQSSCPWKRIPVAHADVDEIQRHLWQFLKAYPQALSGSASATNARDLMACAQFQVNGARPDDVAAFLSFKFQQRRPAPYEPGIQTFGGVITMVREDFRAWFASKSRLDRSASGCLACGCPRQRDGVCAGCNRHPEVAAQFAEERTRWLANASKEKRLSPP